MRDNNSAIAILANYFASRYALRSCMSCRRAFLIELFMKGPMTKLITLDIKEVARPPKVISTYIDRYLMISIALLWGLA
jgi:hypothetical protein